MTNFEEIFIGEDDFDARYKSEVAPWVSECVTDGFFEGHDGNKLHYCCAINPNEKATIVISHGFCEFFDKFHEISYYFYQMGYSVFFVEHRGHGYSYREITDDYGKVSVDSYDEYVADMKCFVEKIVKEKSITKKLFLFAHSMGGCIGSLYIEEHPKDFSACVLSSPMLDFNFGSIPPFAVKILFGLARLFHWQHKYVPTEHAFNPETEYKYPMCSASSKARYDYQFNLRCEIPEYTSWGATYSWVMASVAGIDKLQANTAKIACPVVLYQAGLDHMVNAQGQADFIEHIKANGQEASIKCFPNSRHELFNGVVEDRREYYNDVFDFYERHL